MLVSLRPLARAVNATSARRNPARASASASADAMRRRSGAPARPWGVHLAEPLGRAWRQRVTPEEGRTLLDLDRQTHGSKVEAPQKLTRSERSERKAISRPRSPAEPARAPPLSRRTTQATRAARWL